MKKGTDILSKVDKDPGFKVPDGYFPDFVRNMAESLPENNFKEDPKPSTWLRMRPYVYMAAMFAGVWCMMQIFSDMKNANSRNIGFNPEIADAMSDEKFVNDYMMFGGISDYDLLMEIFDEGIEPDIFDTDTLKL